MKSCKGCIYINLHSTSKYCDPCSKDYDLPNYTPVSKIGDMIEAAERKAFQAGWEGAIDTYEAGDVREYLHEDFEKWKEESK